MATTAQLENVQDAILRDVDSAEAAQKAGQGVTVQQYTEELLVRALTSTIPALLVFEYITGETQTDGLLDIGAAFATTQYEAYFNKGVLNPELGPYEAMGQALGESADFQALSAGKTDLQFVALHYDTIFGPAITNGTITPQERSIGIQHFIDQIEYFKGIYTGAPHPVTGLPMNAATAELLARGAVLGQMIGVASTDLSLGLDFTQPAEDFLRAAVTGDAVYGESFENQPGANVNDFELTGGSDTTGNGFQGGDGDDNFSGTDVTLGVGDDFDGGNGNNRFSYVTSGDNTVVESGFDINAVQQFVITVDNGGNGLIMDMSGVTGLEGVTNVNSSNDLELVGVRNIIDLTVDSPSFPHFNSNNGNVDTTINYTAAATLGSNTQNLTLTDVFDPLSGPPGSNTGVFIFGANGIESLAVTTAGTGASSLRDLEVDGLVNFLMSIDSNQGLFLGDSLNLYGSTSNFTNASDQNIEFLFGNGINANNNLNLTNLGGGDFVGFLNANNNVVLNNGSGDFFGNLFAGLDISVVQGSGDVFGSLFANDDITFTGGAGDFSGDMFAGDDINATFGGGNVSSFLFAGDASITGGAGDLNGGAFIGGNFNLNGGSGDIGTFSPFFVSAGGDIDITVDAGTTNAFDLTSGFNGGDSFVGAPGSTNELFLNASNLGGTASGAATLTFTGGGIGDSGFFPTLDVGALNGTGLVQQINVGPSVGLDNPTFINLTGGSTINFDNSFFELIGDTINLDFAGDFTSSQTIDLVVDNSNFFLFTVSDFDNTFPFNNNPIDTLNVEANNSGFGFVTLTGLGGMDHLGLSGNSSMFLLDGGGNATIETVAGAGADGNIDLSDLDNVFNGTGVGITLGNGANTIVLLTGTNFVTVGDGSLTLDGGTGADNVTVGSSLGSGFGSFLDIQTGNGIDSVTILNSADGTIELGSGADVVNLGGGTYTVIGGGGADDININGGGPVTIKYNLTSESGALLTDSVNGFRSGTDDFDLTTALGIIDPNDIVFLGNVANGTLAAAALSGSGEIEAVYNQGDQLLMIDSNGDGNFTSPTDMIVEVDLAFGNTMAAEDLNTLAFLNFTANSVGFDTSDPNDSIEDRATDGGNDRIIATAAQLVGATIDGAGGFNILDVTTQLATAADFDFEAQTNLITDIDVLNLRAGSGPFMVTLPNINGLIVNLGAPDDIQTFNSGSFFFSQTINGSTGADDITLNNRFDVVNAGDGADEIDINQSGFAGAVFGEGDSDTVNVNVSLGTATINAGPGLDILNLAAGVDISQASFSGWVFTNIANNGNVAMSVAQHAGSGGISNINGVGTNTVTLIGSGSTNSNSTIESYILANNGNLTIFTAAQNVNSNNGDINTVTINVNAATGTFAGDGNDTLAVNNDRDISGATFSGFGTLSLGGSTTDVTLGTEDAVFSAVTGIGTNSLTFSNAGSASLGTVTGLDTVIALNLLNNETLTLSVALGTTTAVNIGDSDLSAGGSAGAVFVTAAGDATGQFVTTGGGADNVTLNGDMGAAGLFSTGGGTDTVTVNAAQDAAADFVLGSGADIINYNADVQLSDVDGGSGSDALNVNFAISGTDLDDVDNVETITQGGNNAVSLLFDNGVFDANTGNAGTLNFTAMTTAFLFLDLSAETDSALTVNVGAGDSTISMTSNNLVDTYVLRTSGGGDDSFALGANNTVANVANADAISNFNASGNDSIVGVAPADAVWSITLSGSTVATFAADMNSELAAQSIALTANDLVLVTVTGGSLAGFYGVLNINTAAQIDNADQLVEFIGAPGAIDQTDFV